MYWISKVEEDEKGDVLYTYSFFELIEDPESEAKFKTLVVNTLTCKEQANFLVWYKRHCKL